MEWSTDDVQLAGAIEAHRELIAAEVLATAMTRVEQLEGTTASIGDTSVTARVERSG